MYGYSIDLLCIRIRKALYTIQLINYLQRPSLCVYNISVVQNYYYIVRCLNILRMLYNNRVDTLNCQYYYYE